MEGFHEVLDFAKNGDFIAMFEALVPLKKHVNKIPGRRAFGLLHQAAYWGDNDAIQRLVTEFGATLGLLTRDENPRPAQEVALERDHISTAEYLETLMEAGGTGTAGSRAPEPPVAGSNSPKRQRVREPEENKDAIFGRIHKGTSPYISINCVQYKRALLQMVAPERNAIISLVVAQKAWEDAKESGGRVTPTEAKTLQFIVDEGLCKISANAKEFLLKKLEGEQAMEIKEACIAVDVGVIDTPAEEGASEIMLAPLPLAKKKGPKANEPKENNSIKKGDEIRIVTVDEHGNEREEYYRVYDEKDGRLDIGELAQKLQKNSKVSRYVPRPLSWARSMGGMTPAFRDAVVNFVPDEQRSCRTLLRWKFKEVSNGYQKVFPKRDGELPTGLKARQKAMIYAYTSQRPSLYSEVTSPLRSNDPVRMERYAAYIRELQDCFRSGQTKGLLQPFIGCVWRCETLAPEDLKSICKFYAKGEEVTYASFTSTSACRDAALEQFKGRNLLYEIHCNENCLPSSDKEYYFPAYIAPWSAFKFLEEEVLFPSQCKFRVVNMIYMEDFEGTGEPKLTIVMETCEWPSVWEMIEQNDVKKFKTYVARNQAMLQTEGAQFSVLGTLADECAKNPEEDFSEAVMACVSNGANLDEVDTKGVKVAEKITKAIDKIGKDNAKSKNLIKAVQVFEMHGESEHGVKYGDSKSYYKQENKVIMVRSLLDIAGYHGFIGKQAAEVLAKRAKTGKGLTDRKKNAINRILNGDKDRKMQLPADQGETPVKIKFTEAGRKILTDLLKGRAKSTR